MNSDIFDRRDDGRARDDPRGVGGRFFGVRSPLEPTSCQRWDRRPLIKHGKIMENIWPVYSIDDLPPR